MILSSFYEAMLNRLMNGGIGLKHFDLWNQQYLTEEEELPFNRPAIFFEYNPQDWVSLANKKQATNATFMLHILSDDVIQETSSIETLKIRNLGLDHLKLVDKVNALLMGFNGAGFGSISRTGLTFDHDFGAMHITLVQYKTRLTDTSAKEVYKKHTTADLLIKPNMLPEE